MISSTGRLFDAVSALLGICLYHGYQAEAAMKLEALSDPDEHGVYPFELDTDVVSFTPMFRHITEDLLHRQSPNKIAAMFHNTLVVAGTEMALNIRKKTQINRVVLSGGSFQNRILTGKLSGRLHEEGFEVFVPSRIPVNDQGIALGQLAIGAARLKQNTI